MKMSFKNETEFITFEAIQGAKVYKPLLSDYKIRFKRFIQNPKNYSKLGILKRSSAYNIFPGFYTEKPIYSILSYKLFFYKKVLSLNDRVQIDHLKYFKRLEVLHLNIEKINPNIKLLKSVRRILEKTKIIRLKLHDTQNLMNLEYNYLDKAINFKAGYISSSNLFSFMSRCKIPSLNTFCFENSQSIYYFPIEIIHQQSSLTEINVNFEGPYFSENHVMIMLKKYRAHTKIKANFKNIEKFFFLSIDLKKSFALTIGAKNCEINSKNQENVIDSLKNYAQNQSNGDLIFGKIQNQQENTLVAYVNQFFINHLLSKSINISSTKLLFKNFKIFPANKLHLLCPFYSKGPAEIEEISYSEIYPSISRHDLFFYLADMSFRLIQNLRFLNLYEIKIESARDLKNLMQFLEDFSYSLEKVHLRLAVNKDLYLDKILHNMFTYEFRSYIFELNKHLIVRKLLSEDLQYHISGELTSSALDGDRSVSLMADKMHYFDELTVVHNHFNKDFFNSLNGSLKESISKIKFLSLEINDSRNLVRAEFDKFNQALQANHSLKLLDLKFKRNMSELNQSLRDLSKILKNKGSNFRPREILFNEFYGLDEDVKKLENFYF